MPPLVLSIISFVQLAIKAAPEEKAVFEDGKQLIASVFQHKMITKAQQDQLMQWANAHMQATLAGQEPAEMKVTPSAPQQQQQQQPQQSDATDAPTPASTPTPATAPTAPANPPAAS